MNKQTGEFLLLGGEGRVPTNTPPTQQPESSSKDVRLLDVLAKIGRDFEPNPALLQVGDLLKAGGVNYATKILSRIIGTEVTYARKDSLHKYYGKIARALRTVSEEVEAEYVADSLHSGSFTWQGCHRYAPENLEFCVDENSILIYDDRGILQNPVGLQQCPQTESCFDFSLEARVVYSATGIAESHDRLGTFYPAQTLDVQDVLLVTAWGGTNSKTRGLTLEFAQRMLKRGLFKFFEKVSSKHGKEGYDYIIIPLIDNTDLQRAVSIDGITVSLAQADNVTRFAHKLNLINQAKQNHNSFSEQYEEIIRQLDALRNRVDANPVLDDPFVTKPDVVILGLKEFCIDNLSPEMSINDLAKALPDSGKLRNLQRELERVQIEVEAWEEFAPQFSTLQPVARKLYGWIQVDGTHAELHMNHLKAVKPNGHATEAMIFMFTDCSLYSCARLLDCCLREANKSKECNKKLLAELLSDKEVVSNSEETDASELDTEAAHNDGGLAALSDFPTV